MHTKQCPFEQSTWCGDVSDGGVFTSDANFRELNRNLYAQVLFSSAAAGAAGQVEATVYYWDPVLGRARSAGAPIPLIAGGQIVAGDNGTSPFTIPGGAYRVVFRNNGTGLILSNVTVKVWEQLTAVQGRNDSNINNIGTPYECR